MSFKCPFCGSAPSEVVVQFLTKSDLANHFNVTTRTIDSWVAEGKFPQPERLPSGRPRWPSSVLWAKEGE